MARPSASGVPWWVWAPCEIGAGSPAFLAATGDGGSHAGFCLPSLGGMVAAGVFLIRRYYPLIEPHGWLRNSLLVVGFVTIAVGGVLSLNRDNMKQVLAYSTVVPIRICGGDAGTGGPLRCSGRNVLRAGARPGEICLFLTAGSVTEATGSKVLSKNGGLGRRMPCSRLGSAMAAAGMVGAAAHDRVFQGRAVLPRRLGTWSGVWRHGRRQCRSDLAYIGRFWTRLVPCDARSDRLSDTCSVAVAVVALGVATVLFGLWIER